MAGDVIQRRVDRILIVGLRQGGSPLMAAANPSAKPCGGLIVPAYGMSRAVAGGVVTDYLISIGL